MTFDEFDPKARALVLSNLLRTVYACVPESHEALAYYAAVEKLQARPADKLVHPVLTELRRLYPSAAWVETDDRPPGFYLFLEIGSVKPAVHGGFKCGDVTVSFVERPPSRYFFTCLPGGVQTTGGDLSAVLDRLCAHSLAAREALGGTAHS